MAMTLSEATDMIERNKKLERRRAMRVNKIEILRRARKLLMRPRGWAREDWVINNFDRDYPALCLGAACQQAAIDLELYPVQAGLEFRVLSRTDVADEVSLLKLVRKNGYASVPAFNDAESTRRKDVIAVIDARIAELEGHA